jgi:hypothetical protein
MFVVNIDKKNPLQFLRGGVGLFFMQEKIHIICLTPRL